MFEGRVFCLFILFTQESLESGIYWLQNHYIKLLFLFVFIQRFSFPFHFVLVHFTVILCSIRIAVFTFFNLDKARAKPPLLFL